MPINLPKPFFSLYFQIIPINNGGSGQGKPLIIETTNLNKPASLSHISPRTGSADKTGSSRMETGSASSSLSPIKIGTASGSSSSKLPLDGAAVTGSTRFSKTGKRIGRPPKKGTQMAISSLGTGTVIGNMAVTASTAASAASTSGSSSEAAVSIKRQVSPPSSPEPDDFDAKRRKTSPNKR